MTHNPADILAALKTMPYLQGADDAALQGLAAMVSLRDIAAGDTIIQQGDVGEEAYLVVSGALVVKVPGDGGRKKLVALIGPGSIAGEMALLTRDPRSADVLAHVDTTVAVLNKKAFDLFRGAGPDIAEKLLRDMTRRQRTAMSRMHNANLILLPTRLAITLGDLARDHGVAQDGGVRIGIPLNFADVADLAVCPVAEATSVIDEWVQGGYLAYQGDYFTLLKPEEF